MPTRIAVLASGRGSNLGALLEHLHATAADATSWPRVTLVASDRADAGALTVARDRGIAAVALPAGAARDAALDEALCAHGAELVVLAGYLKLVPAPVVRRFRGRIVNVHPALLPAFGGAGMYGHR